MRVERRYSLTFKVAMASLALVSKLSARSIAQEFGIPHETLRRWCHQYQAQALAALPSERQKQDLLAVTIHLQADNDRLQEEVVILKKALNILAHQDTAPPASPSHNPAAQQTRGKP
ncbi:MAG: transposase [Ktedonobacterales bacterium]|nr:transposase [Ktedonobacterales bacterium]